MLRACVLLLPFAASCGFRSPTGSDGLDGPPGSDDAAGSRCDFGATWEQGRQPTKTVHVSRTPGTGTPDGSEQNPFPSLLAASSAIEPGVRILLGPGDHGGVTLTDKRGTADAPIWLEGSSSGQARILGGAGPGSGLHLIGAQYWVIRNLKIESLTQSPGINVDDGSGAGTAHHIVIDRVTVADTPRPCLQLSGVTDVTIRESVLGSCDRGVMMVGVQRAVIGKSNIGGMTDAGIAMAGGSADIEVRQNMIGAIEGRAVWIGGESDLNQFRPALTALTGNTEARDIRVFDNVISDVGIGIVCSNCGSSLVAHNLLRNVDDNVLVLHQPYTARDSYQFAPAGGVTFVNNAIEGDSDANAFRNESSAAAPQSCTFSHNMWYRAGGNTWSLDLPTPETMGFNGRQSGYRDNGQLCASANSPAAGAAAPLPEVPGTLQGQCRGTPPSIGPSEPDPGC